MRLLLIFLLCFSVTEGFAQTDAVFLKAHEHEDRLEFWVHNTTNDPIEVTLDLDNVDNLRGNKRKTTASVPANGKILIKDLKIKGEYSFNYELEKRYSEETLASKERNPNNVNIDEGIVVFNKPGCPRCAFLVGYLMENDIDFQLLDLDDRKVKKFMYKLLEDSGVYEKRVMTPIVVVNQKISYSHQDLEGFAEELKKI